MSTEEKPQRLSPFLRRLLILKVCLIEKFRFGERQVTLVWAAVIGILGALVTEGFRRARRSTERVTARDEQMSAALGSAGPGETMRTFSSEINVLVVGVLLVAFVVLAPEGILGFFKRWLRASSR